ncbi:MAG TPA: hypothetical protein VF043_34620 [Ktedonobacteraceae bacterium]
MKGVHYARPCLDPSVQTYEMRVGDLIGSNVCLVMQLTAVSGRLLTFKQPIVPDHADNSKSIILENVRLPYSVLTKLPPGFSSLLITPDGER